MRKKTGQIRTNAIQIPNNIAKAGNGKPSKRLSSTGVNFCPAKERRKSRTPFVQSQNNMTAGLGADPASAVPEMTDTPDNAKSAGLSIRTAANRLRNETNKNLDTICLPDDGEKVKIRQGGIV